MRGNVGLNLEQIPKELRLLLEMIKIDLACENASKILTEENFAEIDWVLFMDFAKHHRLFPLLYTKLKTINPQILPSEVARTIEQEYKNNTFKMLFLASVMDEISKLFTEHEIRLLVLKGPVLAADLYGDFSLRTCRDLDLLVSVNDLEAVDKILLLKGYEKDEEFQILADLSDWKWRHHHIAYFHPTHKIKIEIHWRLNPGPSKEPTFDELWDRKRTSLHTKHPVYSLGREDLFFFLVTHGARHGWSRLRWLVDIHELTKQNVNWKRVLNLLDVYQTLPLGGQTLILASTLLNTTIHRDVLPLIQGNHAVRLAQRTMFYLENRINLHSTPLPENVSRYHDQYLFSLKSFQQKVLYMLSVFYPSITDVNMIKLPKYLYSLYFPLRPFLLILRKLGSNKG